MAQQPGIPNIIPNTGITQSILFAFANYRNTIQPINSSLNSSPYTPSSFGGIQTSKGPTTMSTSFGGYGSAAAQQSALAQAIIEARTSNPANFTNMASNYLNGLLANGVLTNTQVQAVAPTVYYNPQGSGTINYLVNALSGTANPPTNPGTDNSSNTAANNDMNQAKNPTQAFSIGLKQLQYYFTAHPLGLIAVAGLGLLLVLKK